MINVATKLMRICPAQHAEDITIRQTIVFCIYFNAKKKIVPYQTLGFKTRGHHFAIGWVLQSVATRAPDVCNCTQSYAQQTIWHRLLDNGEANWLTCTDDDTLTFAIARITSQTIMTKKKIVGCAQMMHQFYILHASIMAICKTYNHWTIWPWIMI